MAMWIVSEGDFCKEVTNLVSKDKGEIGLIKGEEGKIGGKDGAWCFE